MEITKDKIICCDECGEKSSMIMTVGKANYWGENIADICPSCIAKAYGMMIIAQAEAIPKEE